jgi:F-type H+-transporting ATPase subunit delta
VTGALPTHYARALADAVFRPDSGLDPREAISQLKQIEELIAGSRDLQIALNSPAVNKQRKIAVLSRLAEDLGLHRVVRNFLLVVVTHRRTAEWTGIRERFEEIVDERLGWVRAEIASAQQLTAEQRAEVENALGTALGKSIRADYTIDPTLLEGIRARVASKEYDASLRGKLEDMRRQLTGAAAV